MSFQIKFVLAYMSIALLFIIVHHGLQAQTIMPDSKIKTNVSDVNNALEYVSLLQPKRYEYNATATEQLKLPAGKYYGFLAEEFREIFPYMVSYKPWLYSVGKNAQKSALVQEIKMDGLIPLLVGAIQEQQALIEKLQQEVNILKEGLAK